MRVIVGTVDELTAGTLKRVEIADFPTLVVGNAEGTLFALQDECSHGESSLAEGELDGCQIVCALHAGCFDVRTGKATQRPAKRPQPRYDVEVVDEVVYVLLNDEPLENPVLPPIFEESPAKSA